jgi:ABC-2 type transport system permease protein
MNSRITRFAFGQSRRAALVWAFIVFVLVISTTQGYQNLYPDQASRLRFATTIGNNTGFAALIGVPRHIETTSGFLAWRTGVILAVMLGLWGLLTSTRLLRGEEDAGRYETIAVAPVTRRAATQSILVAIAVAATFPFVAGVLGAALTAASADVNVGEAVWLMLGLTGCGLAFAAFGALASQCFAPRSRATLAGGVFLAAAYILRMVADAEPRFGWMRWLSPIGWLEEMHVADGTRPAVLVLFVLWIAACSGAAVVLAGRRDVGAAMFGSDHAPRARRHTFGRPIADAFLFVRGSVYGWLVGAVVTAFVLGLIAPGAAKAVRESDLQKKLGSLLGNNLGTVSGYIGVTFAIVIAALIAIAPAGHVSAARDEEATGRCETFFAGITSRRRWLWSRIVLALLGAFAMAIAAAVAGWAGQRLAGGDVGFTHLLAATIAYVPVGAAFGAFGIAVFGVAPRLTRGLVTTLVGVAILIEIVGAVIDAPSWILDLSPFFHLGTAPAEPVRAIPVLAMLAVSVVLAIFGVETFVRRDLVAE